MHRDANFPIFIPSCSNLGREFSCCLVKLVTLLLNPFKIWVLRIQLLQAPKELVNYIAQRSGNVHLLHVFTVVLPRQNRQDSHVSDHVGVLWESLRCLVQGGLGLLEAPKVDFRDCL